MKTSEVLYRAADLIEEHGWGQGSASMMGGGGLCAMGAIFAAQTGRIASEAEDGPDVSRAYTVASTCAAGRAVMEYLGFEESEVTLAVWNDVVCTDAVVIETLRSCAVVQSSREREPAAVAS